MDIHIPQYPSFTKMHAMMSANNLYKMYKKTLLKQNVMSKALKNQSMQHFVPFPCTSIQHSSTNYHPKQQFNVSSQTHYPACKVHASTSSNKDKSPGTSR